MLTVGEEEVDNESWDFQFTLLCHIVSDSKDSSKGVLELIERGYSSGDLDSSTDDESIPSLRIREETSRDDTSDDEDKKDQDHHETARYRSGQKKRIYKCLLQSHLKRKIAETRVMMQKTTQEQRHWYPTGLKMTTLEILFLENSHMQAERSH
eukprot:15364497-Ditylum_brightwellii.AAC.2